MWSQIAMALLPWLAVFGQVDRPGHTLPTPKAIDRAVEALGDEDFAVRERASEFLWRAGKAAEPALRKALHSSDAEVAARADRILRYFRYGIHPDTPAEVVTLIGRYRYGTQAAKLAVLKALLEQGETTTLLTLLKTEPDENLRKQLNAGLLKDLDKLAGIIFIKGDWAKAEQLLEIGAATDSGMRNYAAYLLLRGQLEPRISALKERVRSTSSAVDARLLAYLLRAKGDLPGARSAAEAASDTLLTAGILLELGDWKQLARLHENSPENATATLPGGIVDLGYAAAYHRLAGNVKQLDEAVARIKQLAERKPNKLWYCGETLIINERYQDAVELLKDGRPTAAFELLCLQLRFREALRLAGISEPRGPYSPWFAPSGPEAKVGSTQRRERFSMGLLVASMLGRLNEKEQAAHLFLQLATAAREDNNLSMQSLCEAEYRLGLREQAFEHAAVVLSKAWNTSLLPTLFPECRDTAGVWWTFFCRKHPQEPREITLRRLRGFLQPTRPSGMADDDWASPLAEAQRALPQLSDRDRAKWLTAIGETCLARGESRSARDCFLRAAEAAPSPSGWMRLGDLAAADAQWDDAARWYRSAWEEDRTKPTPLYLQGRSLVQAGREVEGRNLIEAARLLPLGSAETRCGLAEELERRGLSDEAFRQWRVVLRTGECQSAAVTEAADRLANLLVGRDDLKAAAFGQWPLLRCLRTSTSNLGIEGYLRRACLIHKTRARGLIALGNIDEALEEIRLSCAALPGEVELALDIVPLLEKAGRPQAADRLFAEVFAANRAVCSDFPRSGEHHHRLARLAAGCRRSLDEGRKHAEQAIALDPDNPDYLSTLADIHHQRGNRREAIELAERALRLAPKQDQFRRQLERFRAH
jgi:tetratricopeptide (TPR) repeat protein